VSFEDVIRGDKDERQHEAGDFEFAEFFQVPTILVTPRLDFLHLAFFDGLDFLPLHFGFLFPVPLDELLAQIFFGFFHFFEASPLGKRGEDGGVAFDDPLLTLELLLGLEFCDPEF